MPFTLPSINPFIHPSGRLQTDVLSSDMYTYNLPTNEWSRLDPSYGEVNGRMLMAHSTVYHPDTNSLIVYGGFKADSEK